MEVASIMSYNMPQSYGSRFPSQQYPQYHDMRSFYPEASSYGNAHSQHATESGVPSQAVSGPLDDPNKPSLPSISTLIGIADGGDRGAAPGTERRLSAEKPQSQASIQPSIEQYPSAYPSGMETGSLQRNNMPPTPPLRSDSPVEKGYSPPIISSGQSSTSGPSYQLGSALNNVEAGQQRSYVPPKPQPVPRQNVYNTSPYAMGPYIPSPSASYYSPEAIYQTNMYAQRPLPSNFPPTVIAAPMMPAGMINTHNPWHHHYITQNQAYPSMSDRYICSTCQKAFSRPSSLKIHSYSHTGEKPFQCPHSGCGKAFSVRSNMKRHERGCHAGRDGSTSPTD